MRSWMIGVIGGILPVAWLPSLPPSPLAAMLVLPGVWLSLSAARTPLAPLAGGCLLGVALALWHGQALLDRRPTAACDLVQAQVTGVVSSLPRVSSLGGEETRQRFEFQVEHVMPAYCMGPRRMLLSYYGSQPIEPGDRWRFDIRLKRPWGLANPGAYNVQAWFARGAIDALGSVRTKSARQIGEAGNALHWHNRLRRLISQRIEQLPLDKAAASVLRALTVADKSGVDSTLWSLFQRFGINHLLVISGLHIGLVAGFGLVIGRVLCAPLLLLGIYRPANWLPEALALLLATGYAALSGFSLATNRALIMLLAFVIASLLGRSSGAWSNLLMAGFLVLLANPLEGLGSGFWLSFGVVAWLLWLGQWRRHRKFTRPVAIHLWIALLMVPLGGWWFGGASLASAPANLFMVPLIGLLVVPLALSGVVLMFPWPQLGEQLLTLAAQPIEWLLPLAEQLDRDYPGRLFWQLSPGLVPILLGVLGLIVVSSRLSLRTLSLAAILSCGLVLPHTEDWPFPATRARLSVLDVGQGSAVVFRDRTHALLYDTGGGDPAGSNLAGSVVLPYLRRAGVNTLDTLLISHGDNDHSAGIATVLAALPVRRILHGALVTAVPGGRPCRGGEAWQWPSGISFRVLAASSGPGVSSNNSSCVLQIEVGDTRLLLPGDIDRKQEKALVAYWRSDLASDLLVAAHHGSVSSSSSTWLKTVQPLEVLFSAGYGNGFGHPHPDVIERVRSIPASYLSTAHTGALEYELNGKTVMLRRAHRLFQRRFWF